MSVNPDQIKSVYIAFRRAQADAKNRGFKIPKDFETHFNNKFKEQNKKILIKTAGYFLTKWSDIDPYYYFKCGFELYKNFSYMNFLNDKVILLYKQRDKNKKREIKVTKEGLINSAKFVKSHMKMSGLYSLDDYISCREGRRRIAIKHYLENKIDAPFFVFLLGKGMVLNDMERNDVPYINANFRKIKFNLEDMRDFLNKLGDKLNE